MNLWNKHQEFPPDFLAQYHDFVLYDVYHNVNAFLLYPLHCSCKGSCGCKAAREKIVFTLNVDHYNKAQERQETPSQLYAMRYFFNIPDDIYFRKHYSECYPLWRIDENFHEKADQNHFQIVGRLVWTLLRLAKTYELSFYQERRATLTEALEIILDKTPLKSEAIRRDKTIYLCGEKGYTAHFNTYKSVCHFIAAYQHIEENNPSFSLDHPQKIQEFLEISHWIRRNLLSITTPNIKEKSLFSEDVLIPLPHWASSKDNLIRIKPFRHKLKEIDAYLQEHLARCSPAS